MAGERGFQKNWAEQRAWKEPDSVGDGGEPRLNVLFRASPPPKEGAPRSQAQDCASFQDNRPLTRSQRILSELSPDGLEVLVPKNVHDNRDKEGQDTGDHKEERGADEECCNPLALGGGRGDAEGHDEGFGEGLEEFHGAPISILGALSDWSSNGTKVTLPMGSTNGARLGVP